ncbi:MAG TPA: TetR family transcriptional regulator [Flavisolibacter sp.]|nr:TetR family transcriptional regulator [Flavisolibacter sp.]
MNVAERLFAQKGFDGTSVRDIAEDAVVNPSMISYYFGSKEGLMQALFQERTGHIGLKLEELSLDDSLSPMEKVEALIGDYVERSLQKRLFYIILVTEQMLQKNDVISGLINDLKKRNIEFLETIINEGQRKGVFKQDIDIALMMNTLVGTVTHTFINQSYYKSYHKLEAKSDDEFIVLLKNKLGNYIKDLFKSILSYEG